MQRFFLPFSSLLLLSSTTLAELYQNSIKNCQTTLSSYDVSITFNSILPVSCCLTINAISELHSHGVHITDDKLIDGLCQEIHFSELFSDRCWSVMAEHMDLLKIKIGQSTVAKRPRASPHRNKLASFEKALMDNEPLFKLQAMLESKCPLKKTALIEREQPDKTLIAEIPMGRASLGTILLKSMAEKESKSQPYDIYQPEEKLEPYNIEMMKSDSVLIDTENIQDDDEEHHGTFSHGILPPPPPLPQAENGIQRDQTISDFNFPVLPLEMEPDSPSPNIENHFKQVASEQATSLIIRDEQDEMIQYQPMETKPVEAIVEKRNPKRESIQDLSNHQVSGPRNFLLKSIEYVVDGNYKAEIYLTGHQPFTITEFAADICGAVGPGIAIRNHDEITQTVEVDFSVCKDMTKFNELNSQRNAGKMSKNEYRSSIDLLNAPVNVRFDIIPFDSLNATPLTFEISPNSSYYEDYILDWETASEKTSQLVINTQTGETLVQPNNLQFKFFTFESKHYKTQTYSTKEIARPGETTFVSIAPTNGFYSGKMLTIPETCFLKDLESNQFIQLWDLGKDVENYCVSDLTYQDQTGSWHFPINFSQLLGTSTNEDNFSLTCNLRVCSNIAGNECGRIIKNCGYKQGVPVHTVYA